MGTERLYGVASISNFCYTVAFFESDCLLVSQLDKVCQDEKPALGDITATEAQKQNIQAILELLEQAGEESPQVLPALYLVTCAIGGEKVVLCVAFITKEKCSLKSSSSQKKTFCFYPLTPVTLSFRAYK